MLTYITHCSILWYVNMVYPFILCWLVSPRPLHMLAFWSTLYIDLDHWYIYHFHNVIYIYAHLDHQGPFIFLLLLDPCWLSSVHYWWTYHIVLIEYDILHLSYADLDHPDPFTCQLFDLHQPLYANLDHWYIDHFYKVICIYAHLD